MSAAESLSYPNYPYADRDKLVTRRERAEQRRYERWQHPTKTRLQRFGATVLTLVSLYSLDVAQGREEVASSNPAVIQVYSAASKAHEHEATVVSAGWGNMNSYYTAAALPAYMQEGNVWSMNYDNKGVDTGIMANRLIKTAQDEGVTALSFSGHSMGGLVDLDVARRVYESKTDIYVPYIILDCTPASIDAVRAGRRSDGYTMVSLLNTIPGARYSTALRFAVEDGVRYDEYLNKDGQSLDLPGFFKTSERVFEQKVLRPDTASSSLLESQFMYIVASGAKDDILALGKDNGKPKPVLVFLRPEDAHADHTVNDDYSQRLFEKYAQEAGLNLVVIKIDGTGHANPIQKHAKYNRALKNVAFPAITSIEHQQAGHVTVAKGSTIIAAGSK